VENDYSELKDEIRKGFLTTYKGKIGGRKEGKINRGMKVRALFPPGWSEGYGNRGFY